MSGWRRAVLRRIDPVAADTVLYTLGLEAPLAFQAGQFVNLRVPEAKPRGERSYSMWSPPAEASEAASGEPQIQWCIKLFPGGAASEYLRARSVGEEVEIRGPYGVFTLHPPGADGEISTFVATGTGLAPFRSMLEECRARAEGEGRPPCRFRLLFGVRGPGDVFGVEELERLRAGLDFDYRICLSQPPEGWTEAGAAPWAARAVRGRVTAALEEAWAEGSGGRWYLCGNGGMIGEIREWLKGRGADRRRVHVEKYW